MNICRVVLPLFFLSAVNGFSQTENARVSQRSQNSSEDIPHLEKHGTAARRPAAPGSGERAPGRASSQLAEVQGRRPPDAHQRHPDESDGGRTAGAPRQSVTDPEFPHGRPEIGWPRYSGYRHGSCATTARQRSAKLDPERLVFTGSAVEPHRPWPGGGIGRLRKPHL